MMLLMLGGVFIVSYSELLPAVRLRLRNAEVGELWWLSFTV
jgi:hypothetical protein